MSSPTKTIDRPPSGDAGDTHRLARGRNFAASSDADLLDAWRRDQHAPALEAIVERYSRMVLSVCRRRCRTENDAEDAYQTTFLYLARNCRKIRRPECLAGWLQRVAQRAAIATLNSSNRETEPMVDPPANPEDPLDRLTQRHAAIVLDEELSDLPEHYRTAIVMHLYEGRPLQTLAEHFGTTVGSIRGRLQRGKQLLAQRLRRRGVVPVVAFTAANAWTVSSSQAVQAAEQFIGSARADLPDAPIDTPLLESLLSEGVRLMPSLYTALGMIGGSALIAALMMNDGSHAQSNGSQSNGSQSNGSQAVVTLPAEVVGQLNADMVVAAQSQTGSTPVVSQMSGGGRGGGEMGGGGGGGGFGGSGPAFPNAGDQGTWTKQAVVPTPSGPIAQQVIAKLDSEADLNLSSRLDQLAESIGNALDIPVMLDQRGMNFAKQDGTAEIRFSGKKPLRTALRSALKPLGLMAIVEEEGLVITANPASLVHMGIGLNRWINIDQYAESTISETLDRDEELEFIELPLRDMVRQLQRVFGLNAVIDLRALEEIGLSGDEPITFSSESISLRNFLDLALKDLDLTYTIRGETLVITTEEVAERVLVNRIYWLEGTGFAPSDSQSIIDTLQTAVVPDTWEALGGPSTMAPLGTSRPALMISTTYTIHRTIEKFFEATRESHFGDEPILERVRIPTSSSSSGGGLGGGGMF